MLPQILDIIAQKYITCYEYYPSFAAVCKSWHSAAERTYHNSNGPPSRFSSLMLAEKSDDQESRELFLLSNKSIRKIRLPEVYGKACTSSGGWLLTVGEDLASQLVNPLSREIINLPKVIFREADQPLDWLVAIIKVVLLMESKLVFVIYSGARGLGFCHIGGNKWTYVEESLQEIILDITFYNGKVYSFDHANHIRACNVNGKDPIVLVDVAPVPEDLYDEAAVSAYIVGLDDGDRKQLLVIIKEVIFNEDGVYPEIYTKSFQILAYDLESGNWSKVNDLGKKTLFVGHNSSFWIEDTTGVINGNCIYYTDDFLGDVEEGGGRDMGIYHISDGTIEPHFVGESLSVVRHPIWLQSV